MDLRKYDCPIDVTVVPAEVRLWDHYLSNFWETVQDLAVAVENSAAARERLASPVEEQLDVVYTCTIKCIGYR